MWSVAPEIGYPLEELLDKEMNQNILNESTLNIECGMECHIDIIRTVTLIHQDYFQYSV